MRSDREDILIEVSPGETRAAFRAEDGRLLELIVERVFRPGLLDATYLGRIIRIEKGVGGAFVDIGRDVPGFLDRADGLHEGQKIIVQVIRDAAGGKGPAVRRRITVAGRYLAYAPDGDGIHWPRGVGRGRAREEIESLLSSIVRPDEGWAVRTKAETCVPEFLRVEADRLRRRWDEGQANAAAADGPTLIIPPATLLERLLRDRAGEGSIVLDDRRTYLAAEQRISHEMPDLKDALTYHDASEPMFEAFGIEEQIEAAIERTVELPRGGRLTFDSTEAMTVVDVDMGGSGERRRTDDAILSVNMAAAAEIGRQIRLRNLAGLIVVDFITMRGKGQGRRLLDAQRRALRGSPVPVDVLGLTAAGLVEITRRRDGPSLAEVICAPVKCEIRLSRESVACAGLRAILRTHGAGAITLVAAPDIVASIEGPLRAAFEDVQRRVGGMLSLEGDPGEAGFRVVSGRPAR